MSLEQFGHEKANTTAVNNNSKIKTCLTSDNSDIKALTIMEIHCEESMFTNDYTKKLICVKYSNSSKPSYKTRHGFNKYL